MNVQESETIAVQGSQRTDDRWSGARSAPEGDAASSSSADEARSAEPKVLDRPAVEEMLGETWDALSKRGVALKFKLMDNDQYQVEVRDKNTDKVIRKLPPDEVVNLSRTLKNLSGALLDTGV